MTDLPTLLAELDAKNRQAQAEMLSRPPYYGPGTMALVNAYPQLREALCALTAWKAEALEVEKQWDVQAVGRAIGAPLGADIRSLILPAITALRTLLEQRTEALRDISEHLQCDPPCKMKPAQGKCGECGAYRFETWCAGCVARAVLAAEGDDHA